MQETSNIFLKKFMLAVCGVLERLNRRIHLHQQRVTIICLNLADKLKLSHTDKTLLFYASLMHDIGVFLTKDPLDILNFECLNFLPHCEAAYPLFNRIELLKDAALPIRYHHDNWSGPNPSGFTKDEIPLLSQIIHLADRLEVLLPDSEKAPKNTAEIINKISHYSGKCFKPELVEHLEKISKERVFWLTLTSEFTGAILNEFAPEDPRKATLDNMVEMASIFAQIVDYKSHQTKDHSVRVSSLALQIGIALKWKKDNLKRLWAAALLHDLGKLSIPDELLEKTSALTPNEYTIMKTHPYFGYLILNTIPGYDEIAEWSLYHHEHLNGKGYPFGVDTSQISTGARILAVADKFTALTEDRPYHKKVTDNEAIGILEEDARQNIIDKDILKALKNIIRKSPARNH